MDESGTLLAVVGASGGVGTSTFVVAVALHAAALERSVCVIDCDPLGGGIDVTLGAEDWPGSRWRVFASAVGRLDAAGVADSLPEVAGIRLLSHDREGKDVVRPSGPTVRSVTDALRRGHDLVIADLPRHPIAECDTLLELADEILVVASGRVRSVAGAITVVADIESTYRKKPQLLVARGSERSLGAARIADSVQADLAGEWLRDQKLSDDLERGVLARLLQTHRGGVGHTAQLVAMAMMRIKAVA